jgi:hypothetical protein
MSYEKALNELKKATMAAYLAKAGGHVRADTSIAKSFDDDVFRHMKVVNQHSPYNVNGAEKDPEKLAHATKQMNVNAELRDQFKRGAQNRIKGIARAGRLLAKEEAIEEGKNPYGPGYKLVDKEGNELKVGHKFMHTSHHEGSKPEHHEITGWQSGEQRGNSSSSGRVSVKVGKGKKAYNTEYFPHVFDMKVVKEDAEPVNELKTSTLASVATKRFTQAQAALKAKDFGGYVKGMKKSQTAADATVPKSGWSPEDDKKNEEVVVSPQEKYRQIKEAKLRARKGK